jgi:SAM-dependent methyltransferase
VELFKRNGCHEVLELGCRQGRDTYHFAREGFRVIALDCSETGVCQMRERAKGLCLEPVVEVLCHDLRAGIPLRDGSVDAVHSHMLFTMELWERDLVHPGRVPVGAEAGGLNLYSVRNDHDPHFGKGPHRGRTCGGVPTASWCITSPRRRSEGWPGDTMSSISWSSTTPPRSSPRSCTRCCSEGPAQTAPPIR